MQREDLLPPARVTRATGPRGLRLKRLSSVSAVGLGNRMLLSRNSTLTLLMEAFFSKTPILENTRESTREKGTLYRAGTRYIYQWHVPRTILPSVFVTGAVRRTRGEKKRQSGFFPPAPRRGARSPHGLSPPSHRCRPTPPRTRRRPQVTAPPPRQPFSGACTALRLGFRYVLRALRALRVLRVLRLHRVSRGLRVSLCVLRVFCSASLACSA